VNSPQQIARIGGALYLVTFITSFPALFLKGPVLNDAEFILGSGGDTGILFAGFLEVILALACIGTAVVLFPIAQRQSEIAALGFVGSRILEAAVIMIGVTSLLAVVTLRQDLAGTAGTDAASLIAVGAALVAIHDWSFLLGPGVLPVVNALCLGYVMYRSKLVPRVIPLMGLIGAPLLAASTTATMFGIYDQVSLLAAIAVLPLAAWELSLGIWLVVKGFRPEALAQLDSVESRAMAA